MIWTVASSVNVLVATASIIINVVTLAASRLGIKDVKPRHKFMANLNIADILISVFSTANSIITVFSVKQCTTFADIMIFCSLHGCYLLVLGSLAILAYDMYIAVCKPLHYLSILTPRKTWILLTTLLICCIVVSSGNIFFSRILILKSQTDYCDESIIYAMQQYIRITIAIFCGSSSIVMMLCYGRVLYEVIKIPAAVHPSISNNQGETAKGKGKRAFVTILLLTGTTVVFMLPIYLQSAIGDQQTYDLLLPIFLTWSTLNSIADPIIYSCRTSEIRSGYRKLWNKITSH